MVRKHELFSDGFRKMTPIEKSSLARSESDQDHLEFSHPNFIQHHPELLINIKRKTPGNRNNENNSVAMPPKEISVLVDEIRQLREKQRTMENKMAHLVKYVLSIGDVNLPLSLF